MCFFITVNPLVTIVVLCSFLLKHPITVSTSAFVAYHIKSYFSTEGYKFLTFLVEESTKDENLVGRVFTCGFVQKNVELSIIKMCLKDKYNYNPDSVTINENMNTVEKTKAIINKAIESTSSNTPILKNITKENFDKQISNLEKEYELTEAEKQAKEVASKKEVLQDGDSISEVKNIPTTT